MSENVKSDPADGPVVAVCKINGTIMPGQIFVPESKEQSDELFALKAVREPSDAELALYEKIEASTAAAKPRKAAKPAPASKAAAPATSADAAPPAGDDADEIK